MMQKKCFLLFSAALVISISSCVVTPYYQMYKTIPSGNIQSNGDALVYEDASCRVIYNLWENGGDIGFTLYNKSNENMLLHLDQSYFILNGIAHDYYQNRTVTTTENLNTGVNYSILRPSNKALTGTRQELHTSSGYAVSYKEKKIIVIPPGTAKSVDEFSINKTLYRNCDLFRYPHQNQIHTVSFSKSTSPLVFSNRIVYSLGQSEETVPFENEFYVQAITNYPEAEFIETRREAYCGQKSYKKIEVLKLKAPDHFYIRYLKTDTQLKH